MANASFRQMSARLEVSEVNLKPFLNRLRPNHPGTPAGFTLVELLVVITIVALLIALLIPTLSKARIRAQTVVCSSNSRQVFVALSMWIDDSKQRLPSAANPPSDVAQVDPAFATGMAYSSSTYYGYAQRYIAFKYLNREFNAFRCPSSRAEFRPDDNWTPTIFSHMGFTGFADYKNNMWANESWGRGHWNAGAGDPIVLDRVISPSHKIFWMDGSDYLVAAGVYLNVIGCSSTNGGWYDQDFTRHEGGTTPLYGFPGGPQTTPGAIEGGVNTIMLDGHYEFHKDADLGSGNGEYNNTQKRYWFAYNVEQ